MTLIRKEGICREVPEENVSNWKAKGWEEVVIKKTSEDKSKKKDNE